MTTTPAPTTMTPELRARCAAMVAEAKARAAAAHPGLTPAGREAVRVAAQARVVAFFGTRVLVPCPTRCGRNHFATPATAASLVGVPCPKCK